jgi:hypothetical protein
MRHRGQNRKGNTVRKRKSEQDSQNRTAIKGQPQRDSYKQSRTRRTGQPGQDYQDRTASEGHDFQKRATAQDYCHRTTWVRQPWQDRKERITEKNSQNRKART